MTRQRMYLETMERLFGGTDKIIIDQGASSRRRSVSAARPASAASARGASTDGSQPMRLNLAGGILAAVILVALIVAYSTMFTVYQTRQALVVRLGQPVRVVTEPGLQVQDPADRQRDLHRQAHPRSRESGAGSDRLRPEAARGRRLRALQDHRCRCGSTRRSARSRAPIRGSRPCSIRRCGACSAKRR